MKMVICSIRDRAADTYGRPIFVPSPGVAIRMFATEINRSAEDNQLYTHPDDFDLFELGVWDDETARFESLDLPKQLALGRQLKVRE